jgi:hypothetical protein
MYANATFTVILPLSREHFEAHSTVQQRLCVARREAENSCTSLA